MSHHTLFETSNLQNLSGCESLSVILIVGADQIK